MKAAEYLSSDILEESHLNSFAPFRVLQMVLGSCRVDAKDRFVTSPTKLQKCYTVFCVLVSAVFYTSVALNFLDKFRPYHNIYYLNLIGLYFHYMTFACNMIHVRFMNNDENITFYVKTQEIDRKLKIDKNKVINDIIFRSNLMTVLIILLILFSLFFMSITEEWIIFVSFGGLLYSQLTCTLEWLYCSNLLVFFYVRLRYINAIITNHLEGTQNLGVKNLNRLILPTMKILRFMAADVHDFEHSETDVYLKDIFDLYLRFQNIYRFQIFLFCFKFVTSTLISFEFGLLAIKNNIMNMLERIVLPIISAIDLIIVIVICVRCEVFSREIKKTKHLCTTVLSLYYGGPLRKKAIKMLKMINEKPPLFSVYDMWHMDASTMLNMINLVTTLIVTLLQFAFL